MDIRSQVSMVFHLDKCIGCHTCSIACKNIWTDRKGTEYMYWNNVETKPGTGYPTRWEDQNKYKGGWVVDGKKQKKLRLRLQGKWGTLGNIFYNPNLPHARRLFRTLDLRLPEPVQRAFERRPAHRARHLDGYWQVHGHHRGGAELGRRPRRLAGLRKQRSELRRRLRGGNAPDKRDQQYRLLLPAAYLQPLSQSGLRGGLPARGDL